MADLMPYKGDPRAVPPKAGPGHQQQTEGANTGLSPMLNLMDDGSASAQPRPGHPGDPGIRCCQRCEGSRQVAPACRDDGSPARQCDLPGRPGLPCPPGPLTSPVGLAAKR